MVFLGVFAPLLLMPLISSTLFMYQHVLQFQERRNTGTALRLTVCLWLYHTPNVSIRIHET